ncbi:ATP-binding protein [Mycolicibacterium moriokaense]|nr:ATP-binding protein [Mycolicibacterium moriokaense]
MRRATTVGLLMRNTVNFVVSVVALADPAAPTRPLGSWLFLALAVWSLYRVATRLHRGVLVAVDYAFVLAVCAAIPALVTDQEFFQHNSAPQAIAGTAVISFAVVMPARISFLMTVGIAATYAWGAARIAGWEHVGDIGAIYYFFLQWTTAGLIRLMLLRVAAAVDRVGSDREAAAVNQQVTEAVRDYEREQLALLHDTAASTLLMVGQGARLPPRRLAAQARRDLEVLHEGPWIAPPTRVELVSALHQCAEHLTTPVEFTGLARVWVKGDAAQAVIAAAREVMNNVDRHAEAARLTVAVSAASVTLRDDGVGFDPSAPRSGRGVTDSIVGRMARAGGAVDIDSAPGSGTVTELRWATEQTDATPDGPMGDPDRLIERIRTRYGLAITIFAIANLAVTVPFAVMSADHPAGQLAAGVAAAVSALTALPGILRRRWELARVAAVILLVVAVVQPFLLSAEYVGGQYNWTQSTIGWCVLPLLLGLPTRTGLGILVFYWVAGAVAAFVCNPSVEMLVNIGLGTASILSVQLFALMFNGLMRDAAADAQAETQTRRRLVLGDIVAQALRAEYQRRYAKLVDNVVPLLKRLGDEGEVDDGLRRSARAESRRLRALFDQATTFDNPLMQQVRPLIDAAEARQVDVVVDVAGDLPDLTGVDIFGLVDQLATILPEATTSVRLVVSATMEEITASVVCPRTPAIVALATKMADDDVEIVSSDDSVWFLIGCRSTDRQRSARPSG